MLQTTESTNRYILPIDKVSIKGSYPLGISEIKTIHIVFPFEIKEVDAGTSDVIVEITPSFNNVLKVKSAKSKDFTETNLTVLTGDGGLYSFITNYQKDPEILNINIGNNLKTDILNLAYCTPFYFYLLKRNDLLHIAITLFLTAHKLIIRTNFAGSFIPRGSIILISIFFCMLCNY